MDQQGSIDQCKYCACGILLFDPSWAIAGGVREHDFGLQESLAACAYNELYNLDFGML